MFQKLYWLPHKAHSMTITLNKTMKNVPGESEPAVVPREGFRKVLEKEKAKRRMEVFLYLRESCTLVYRVLELLPAFGVFPVSAPDGAGQG